MQVVPVIRAVVFAASTGYSLWSFGKWLFTGRTEEQLRDAKDMERFCRVLGCGPDDPKELVERLIRKKKAQFHPDHGAANKRALEDVAEAIAGYSRLRKWDKDADFKNPATAVRTWAARTYVDFTSCVRSSLTRRRLRDAVVARVCGAVVQYVHTVHCVDGTNAVPLPNAEPITFYSDTKEPDSVTWGRYDANRARCPLGLHVEYTTDPSRAMKSGEVHRIDGVVTGFTAFTQGDEPIHEVVLMETPPDNCAWKHRLFKLNGEGPWLVGFKRQNGTTLDPDFDE